MRLGISGKHRINDKYPARCIHGGQTVAQYDHCIGVSLIHHHSLDQIGIAPRRNGLEHTPAHSVASTGEI
jgi:hypothetical protein